MDRDPIVTRDEFRQLQRKLSDYKTRLAKITRDKAESGLGMDGWHDEGFQRGLVEEAAMMRQVKGLEILINSVQVIDPEEQDEFVALGSRIIIEYDDGETSELNVVGYHGESSEDCVTMESPMGKALLGLRLYEKRRFFIGDCEVAVRVIGIFPPSSRKSWPSGD